MSNRIWTKAKIQDAKDRGINIQELFKNISNYVYIERYYLESRKKYLYSLYTAEEVIIQNITRDSSSNEDYVLLPASEFNKVFDILSEVGND